MVNKFTQDPGSKVHGVNIGPTWGRQDPGGPYVGPMNLAIWVAVCVLRGLSGSVTNGPRPTGQMISVTKGV